MEGEETQHRLIKYVLMNTPVGEHKEVLNDLQVLLGSEAIQSEAVSLILLEALASHGTTIKNESKKIQLTPFSCLGGSNYFDPKEGLSFDVNPFELSICNIKHHASNTSYTSDLQSQLDTYLQNHFAETSSGRAICEESNYRIFYTSHNLNLKNMWTSEWIGDWLFTPTSLSGTTTLKIHYFEEGNFQLSECESYSYSLPDISPQSPDHIFQLIKDSDTSFQAIIQDLYSSLPTSFFKPMRRSIPVTHTRFSEMSKSKMLS